MPAGTFRAFKIDLVSAGLILTVNYGDYYNPVPITSTVILHSQVYLEYNSLRVIKSSMLLQETTPTIDTPNWKLPESTITMVDNSTLTQDTKP